MLKIILRRLNLIKNFSKFVTYNIPINRHKHTFFVLVSFFDWITLDFTVHDK